MSFARASDYEPKTQDKVVGLFLFIAFLVVIFLLFNKSFLKYLVGERLILVSEISQSYGLTKGTVIQLSGIPIGEVSSVELEPSSRVLLQMSFDVSKAPLLKRGSTFHLNTQLGLDTVLSGASLQLLPGEGPELLEHLETVAIIEPKSLDDFLEELKPQEVAEQVKSIVSNLDELSGGLARKKQAITGTIDNLEEVTGNLTVASAELSITLSRLSQTSEQATELILSINNNLNSLSAPTENLVSAAESSLKSIDETLKSMGPAIEQTPALLNTTQQTLQSLNYLTQRLSNHWLLGESRATATGPEFQSLPDNSLYEPQ